MTNINWKPAPTADEILETAKQKQKTEINKSRDNAVNAGFEYDFGGTIDVVQTSPTDLENIQVPVQTAHFYQSVGTSETIPFRALSNTIYQLTPDEMIALGMNVVLHKQTMFQKAWDLKEQVSAVKITTTVDDAVAEVQSITWGE